MPTTFGAEVALATALLAEAAVIFHDDGADIIHTLDNRSNEVEFAGKRRLDPFTT
jgi:hypothetical protein